MVTTAQYMLTGMLVKPYASPSTTYITVPIMTMTVTMTPRNTVIFRRLAPMAWRSCSASPRNGESLKIRNTRSKRMVRITMSDCASGARMPR